MYNKNEQKHKVPGALGRFFVRAWPRNKATAVLSLPRRIQVVDCRQQTPIHTVEGVVHVHLCLCVCVYVCVCKYM